MKTVYLVAAEPSSAPALTALIQSMGGKSVHSCAWVLPWKNLPEALGTILKASLRPGTHLVISEAIGEWTVL